MIQAWRQEPSFGKGNRREKLCRNGSATLRVIAASTTIAVSLCISGELALASLMGVQGMQFQFF
jgi:hypothetical protein